MKRVANFEAVDGVWFQIKMMELSNAVGRYLSSAARQRELLGGHTYLMQVQSWKESEGVLQIVFYLVGEWCRGVVLLTSDLGACRK